MDEILALEKIVETGFATREQKARLYYLRNRDNIVSRRMKFYYENRDRVNAERNKRHKERVINDPDFAEKERQRLREYKEKNRKYVNEKSKKWQSDNGEKRKEIQRKYREKNKEKIKQYTSTPEYKEKAIIWRLKHAHTDKYAESKKRWNKENKDKLLWRNKQRSEKIKLATIGGTTFRDEIIKIYKECLKMKKETGVKYVVDHICPIRHSLVCGLNVPWNMRIISHDENAKKSNKLDINLILP